MNKNVDIGALFLCNLALIPHSAPWSVNSSIFARGRLWNPGHTTITIESDNKGGEMRDTKTLNLSRNIICCKIWIDVFVFHLAWSSCRATKIFVVGWRKFLVKAELCSDWLRYFTIYLNKSVSVEELSADSCPAEIWFSQNKYLPEKRTSRSTMLVLRRANFY